MQNKYWVLFPTVGILIFILLYFIASLYYPGGSNLDKAHAGFDWFRNYWCDLTGELAKNGKINAARPTALVAMVILCVSMSWFWYHIPRLILDRTYAQAIPYLGISSMSMTAFLFTSWHDTIINVAGTLGSLALIITFMGLYKNGSYSLFVYGFISLILLMFNFIIYETNQLIEFQPIIQKINFIFFLSWICALDIKLFRMLK